MKMVSMIGCGALGRTFAENFSKAVGRYYRLAGVLDQTPSRAEALAQSAGCASYASLTELLAERPDFVVEFAGGEAVRSCGEAVLSRGCSLILVSIGALADDGVFARLREAAAAGGGRLYIASGAIGGFDLMRTLSLMEPLEALVENRKAPGSLNGAPYLGGRILSETEPETVFRGCAREAIRGFPQNVNVAVAAALASCGVDDTQVAIHSVPGQEKNEHTILLRGRSTEAVVTISSQPDPANPKSSTMAAFSVLALLLDLASPVSFF